MQFTYKAQNTKGEIEEGKLEAPDRFAVARDLRGRGLIPVVVTPVAKKFGEIHIAFIDNLFSHVSLREKILFTHNLSGMISAGLTLYRAIEVQKKQTKNKAVAEMLSGLLDVINKGGTLSEGLAKYPNIFSTLFVSMVRAGEESGNLSGALKEIGDSLQKSYDLTRKIKGAMLYPMVIISAILIIGVLMLIFVVPTLTKIFKDLGTDLPTTTQFVILISDTASQHPILFLLGTGLLVGVPVTIFRMKRFARLSDTITLKIPVVGQIARKMNSARTARTLSSLLAAGVEMTRAIEITKDVLQNSYYKEVVEKAGESVQKGGSLSESFKNASNLYPVMVGEMIAVGEETGALTQMLADVATFYEDEVDAQTKNLSTIIEPVLMLMIGGAVGFFAVSMLSPMYSLLDSLSAS